MLTLKCRYGFLNWEGAHRAQILPHSPGMHSFYKPQTHLFHFRVSLHENNPPEVAYWFPCYDVDFLPTDSRDGLNIRKADGPGTDSAAQTP